MRHDQYFCVKLIIRVSPQTQRSLKETRAALLQRVDEVTEQLKQESQRALELEGHLTASNLSLQNLDKVPL